MSIIDCLKGIQALAHKILQKEAEYKEILAVTPKKYYEGVKALKNFIQKQEVAEIVIAHGEKKLIVGTIGLDWDINEGFKINRNGSLSPKHHPLDKIAEAFKRSLERTLDKINNKIQTEQKEINTCEKFITILEEVQKQTKN